jgi:enamine deaminase RidA (YjgF/YER057c/UK114 family)
VVRIEQRLQELGIELPPPPQPVGNYIGAVQVGDVVYLGGVSNRVRGVLKYQGKLGRDLTLEQGYDAARMAAINHLAILKAFLGDLDRVERIVKVVGHINCAPGFNTLPPVLNGASDLLVDVFGDKGRHTRLALGASELNDDIPVETEMIIQVRPPTSSYEDEEEPHGR